MGESEEIFARIQLLCGFYYAGARCISFIQIPHIYDLPQDSMTMGTLFSYPTKTKNSSILVGGGITFAKRDYVGWTQTDTEECNYSSGEWN